MVWRQYRTVNSKTAKKIGKCPICHEEMYEGIGITSIPFRRQVLDPISKKIICTDCFTKGGGRFQ